ncbi:hypothetical protein AB0M22_09150 [Nocardia sp. NPDC051756]|uniref:hypothetical protein n=1 Tax=Nocardia sp. NPDC051756 TaxID=3154751 RepID=UPI003412DD3B
MTTQPVPFAPGAARMFLIAQPEFTALVPASSVTTREAPDPITGPFVTIRAPGNVGVDPLLRKPLIQIDVWTPKIEILGGTTDPEELAWDIAAMAATLLARARAQEFRASAWTARWTDGPISSIDTTRGPDQPLYRALVRLEMKLRAPRTT